VASRNFWISLSIFFQCAYLANSRPCGSSYPAGNFGGKTVPLYSPSPPLSSKRASWIHHSSFSGLTIFNKCFNFQSLPRLRRMILRKALLWASSVPWRVTSSVKQFTCLLVDSTWEVLQQYTRSEGCSNLSVSLYCYRKQFLHSITYLITSVFTNRTAHFVLRQ
jgi:hypothetical protein